MVIPYRPDRGLISLHAPKTGGTSLQAVLSEWFGDQLHLHYTPPRDHPKTHALNAGVCVHGHFNAARGKGVDFYYPHAEQYMIFLREPFARFASLWRFFSKRRQEGRVVKQIEGCDTFEAFLQDKSELQRDGRNPTSLVWQFPHAPMDAVRADEAFEQRFVFVGIMERYQQSVDALANALGKPPLLIPHVNTTDRESGEFNRYRALFERAFETELEIYQSALAANTELLRSFASRRLNA